MMFCASPNGADSSGAEVARPQHILVFQQKNKAASKIAGIQEYGDRRFALEVVSLPDDLPPVIDDTENYLPASIEADLVLDYLTHPDLSCDLADLCRQQGVPLVATGKKLRQENKGEKIFSPPT